MGKEQPATYYDAIYLKSEAYKTHWSKSRYIKLWEAVLNEIDLKSPIIDIGCGPGQFANMCSEKGCVDYFGLDFSEHAINIAKILNHKSEALNFHQCDIFKVDYVSDNECQFIMLEVMEHIEKDLEFLAKLKKGNEGKKIVITVPTFNDAGHARYFKTEKEWVARFHSSIKIIKSQTIGPWILIVAKL